MKAANAAPTFATQFLDLGKRWDKQARGDK